MTTDPNTSMPITMEGVPEQERREASNNSLLEILVDTINTHIYNEVQAQLESQVTLLVTRAFNAMVENRRTLALMDQALETMIDQKIEAAVTVAIDRHEDNEAHNTQEDIEQMAADTARETLREYAERQEGWVTKDQVNDLITEHVDEELDRIDWEEKVKDVIRDML